MKSQIRLRWGRLRLRTLSLAPHPDFDPTQVTMSLAAKPVTAKLAMKDGKAEIELGEAVWVNEGQALEIALS